jgi:hypothetical protein
MEEMGCGTINTVKRSTLSGQQRGSVMTNEMARSASLRSNPITDLKIPAPVVAIGKSLVRLVSIPQMKGVEPMN